MADLDIKGRIQPVALVTGGARRIGAALSMRLAEAGYAVVIHAGRSTAEANGLVAEIERKGGRASALQADLGNADDRLQLIEKAITAFGPLSLLVNNAALFQSDTLQSFDDDDFMRHMVVNLLAPVSLSRDFARQAVGTDNPSIINIVDHRVAKLTPQHFTYTLSKSGLHAATFTMAQALAPQVRVNAIAPGPTLPNNRDGVSGLEKEAAGVLLERAVNVDDIAHAVLYLANSRSVTGEMIFVDSGQHLSWRTPDIVKDQD
jgi:NAD(P)-dependent dehydrogenase (short-subunit alcohol dehydrogenase family)